MESPLDILSRAAGMVSRNNDSGSVVISSSGGNGNGNGGNDGIGSSIEHIIAADNQCRILKLALVSSNSPNSMSNNSTSQIQNGSSSKDLGSRGDRLHLQDYTKLESSSPPPVGLRTVAVGLVEKRIERQMDQHDLLSSSDSDSPIDMSMKKVKRKLTTSDSNDEASSDERDRDEKIKRKRPSVISFASQHRMMSNNVTGFDVDDHFKKSLGLEFYNSVFSGDKKLFPSTPPSRSPVPTTTTPDEVQPEDKKKLFKPKLMASHAKGIKSVNHAPDMDNSVDDHFAKALGKSTWMRLQQGL